MKHEVRVFPAIASNCDRNSLKSKNQFGFQNKSYSHIHNRNTGAIALISKILNISVNYSQGIHPRLFCRHWFGLSATNENGRPRFTQGQIEAMESEHGYREKCINLLAKLLKIKPNTVHRWGRGVSFDKIPNDKLQQYEIYLGYIYAIRVITTSLAELDEASLLRLLQQLEARQ